MSVEKNLAEMAQGMRVSQRHARLAQLYRWEKARKINLRFVLDTGPPTFYPAKWQVWLFNDYCSSMIPPGTLLAEYENSNDFPTEAFVAQVALGIQALSNFEGVEAVVQLQLTPDQIEQRKHVIDWKKWAPA